MTIIKHNGNTIYRTITQNIISAALGLSLLFPVPIYAQGDITTPSQNPANGTNVVLPEGNIETKLEQTQIIESLPWYLREDYDDSKTSIPLDISEVSDYIDLDECHGYGYTNIDYSFQNWDKEANEFIGNLKVLFAGDEIIMHFEYDNGKKVYFSIPEEMEKILIEFHNENLERFRDGGHGFGFMGKLDYCIDAWKSGFPLDTSELTSFGASYPGNQTLTVTNGFKKPRTDEKNEFYFTIKGEGIPDMDYLISSEGEQIKLHRTWSTVGEDNTEKVNLTAREEGILFRAMNNPTKWVRTASSYPSYWPDWYSTYGSLRASINIIPRYDPKTTNMIKMMASDEDSTHISWKRFPSNPDTNLISESTGDENEGLFTYDIKHNQGSLYIGIVGEKAYAQYQAKDGKSWNYDLPEDIQKVISKAYNNGETGDEICSRLGYTVDAKKNGRAYSASDVNCFAELFADASDVYVENVSAEGRWYGRQDANFNFKFGGNGISESEYLLKTSWNNAELYITFGDLGVGTEEIPLSDHEKQVFINATRRYREWYEARCPEWQQLYPHEQGNLLRDAISGILVEYHE